MSQHVSGNGTSSMVRSKRLRAVSSVAAAAFGALIASVASAGDEGFPTCGPSGPGSCFALHGTGGCNDASCCNSICAIDSFCCDVEWDYLCRQMAVENCNPPVPANDNPAGAPLVFAGLVAFDTVGATDSDFVALPTGCGGLFGNDMRRDVWFEYRASRTGTARIDTCPVPGTGARSDFDSILVVRDDDTLASIACNDESSFCGGYAIVEFAIETGERYLIQIGGHDEYVGQGAMLITETGDAPAAPVNDACLGAIYVPADDVTADFDLLGAARDGAQCSDAGVDVWFAIGPAKENGILRLRGCSSDGAVALEAASGSCDGQRTCSAVDSCGAAEALPVAITPGEVVYVRVAGAAGIAGTLDIDFEPVAACPSDFNDDGVVNAADLSALLLGWGTPAGDVNGDGATNATDLSELLLAWGACS